MSDPYNRLLAHFNSHPGMHDTTPVLYRRGVPEGPVAVRQDVYVTTLRLPSKAQVRVHAYGTPNAWFVAELGAQGVHRITSDRVYQQDDAATIDQFLAAAGL